jgi:hypothetical protein
MLAAIGINAQRSERFDFRFNAGAFLQDEIFDSALCPPSRYIIELARRVFDAMPTAEILLIGNPLLPLRTEQIASWAASINDCPSILSDSEGFPLVYCLPRRLFEEDHRFLLPLSTVTSTIDARLITLLLGQETPCLNSGFPAIGEPPIPYGGDGGSQWITQAHQRQIALRLQCVNAIGIIEKNDRWRAIPTANFHPNHAGDVLFWSLASHDVERPLFQRHIICENFVEIARAGNTRLDLIRLCRPPLARVEGAANETSYFVQALEQLGKETTENNFIIFTRFLRNYGHSAFHLIDQARFSLGDSLVGKDRTVQHRAPLAPETRCPLPLAPLRILLHLSGAGWALKAYPRPSGELLCKTLVELGCQVSVIGDPDLEAFGARSITCGTVLSLQQAACAHHLFVGIDSFPHHFVRHVMGWPTIGLFANTKTCNSDAAGGITYQTATNRLPCNPCGHLDICPAFGSPHCHNHLEPGALVKMILDMARNVYDDIT